MDKKEGDAGSDDGIVAEDVTQLVEHIELTGPQRLIDAPEWEMATPAADLDEAPFLIDDHGARIPQAEPAPDPEDLELFTETHFDIGRHAPGGEHATESATLNAAERRRWQKRVESLLMTLAERDELLAEREQKLEELTARIATMTLERASLTEQLQDVGAEAAAAELQLEPEPQLQAAAEPAVPQPAPAVAEPVAEPAPADTTAEMPMIRITRAEEARAAPAVRRYLIGIDLVGVAHEITRARINIGRTQDNDLRILEPTVSRLHAVLTLRNGEATIVDANSRNGIFVNGIQVRYAKLEDGDVVTFGTVRFRYRVGGSAAGTAYGAA